MNTFNIFLRSNQAQIKPCAEIPSGFSIGFDKRIPEATQLELRRFVSWCENNFEFPIQLWVDFEYRHYLRKRDRSAVGYLFYWSDFKNYPYFDDLDERPIICLPVRTERSSMDDILHSFVQAICCYHAWLLNKIDHYEPDEADVEEILRAYSEYRSDACFKDSFPN